MGTPAASEVTAEAPIAEQRREPRCTDETGWRAPPAPRPLPAHPVRRAGGGALMRVGAPIAGLPALPAGEWHPVRRGLALPIW